MRVKFVTEEKLEINRLAKSVDMAIALWDIQQIHRQSEWYIDNNNITPTDVRDWYIEKINDIFERNGINLAELIE